MNKSKTIQSYFMKVGDQQNRDTPEKGLDLQSGKSDTPPAKKIKESESGELLRKQKSKEYEIKRKRTFQPDWKTKFDWIEYDETTGMRCKVCIKYEKNGTFSTGCTNFKIEAIRKHDRSLGHTTHMARYKAETAKPGTSEAVKCVIQLNKALFAKLSILFKNAHALAKNNRPYTDFEWLCQLDEAKGVDIGTSYRTDKKAAEFIHAMAQDARNKIKEEFQESNFFSVILDGATDTSSQEAEICYVRLCRKGNIKVFFLGITNVGKANAENILRATTTMLNQYFGQSWMSKIVGTGTDGASVMLGCRNGFVMQLKNYTERDFIFSMHCSAHRLELAYKESCKEVPLFKIFDTLMLNLYLFYRNSPLNRHNLKEAFKTFNREPLMPVRASGTRWLAHMKKAIDNILKGYGPIMLHLVQVRAIKSNKNTWELIMAP